MNDDAESHIPAGIINVAIIFCTSTAYSGLREKELFADQEILEVASAVKKGLEINGYRADLINLDPDNIEALSNYDCIFNLVETIYGFPLTDYEITRRLESLGIPFTGSSAETLESCLNKSVTKNILKSCGIATPDYQVVAPGDNIQIEIPFPVIVKPVHEDGCVGITVDSKVSNIKDLTSQVQKIHRIYQQPALVEAFIDGRDITVSILGNGLDAAVLPLFEIVYSDTNSPKHLTFEANWVAESKAFHDSKSRRIDNLESAVMERIKTMALSAYNTMGCRDYARVDFRLQGNLPYILEVNPNPCINPDDTGFVKSSLAAGYSYHDLVTNILMMAINGHRSLTPIIQEEQAVL